jgi:hypothetical protein
MKPSGVSGDSRCWEDRSHGTSVELLARVADPGGADGRGADAGLSLVVRRDHRGGAEAGHRDGGDAAYVGAPGGGRCRAAAGGLTSAEHAEIRRLRRENAELRRANEILKSASVFFAAEVCRPQSR